MNEEQRDLCAKRREFLKGAAIAGGAGAVFVSAPARTLAQTEESGGDEASGTGYRLTAHILAYYRTAAS